MFPRDAITIHKHVVGNTTTPILTIPVDETYTLLFTEMHRMCDSPHDRLTASSSGMMISHATDSGVDYLNYMNMEISDDTLNFITNGTACQSTDHHFISLTYVPRNRHEVPDPELYTLSTSSTLSIMPTSTELVSHFEISFGLVILWIVIVGSIYWLLRKFF